MSGAGVEPTSLRRRASAVFQPSKLTAHEPDYPHGPSGVNDIILNWVCRGGGSRTHINHYRAWYQRLPPPFSRDCPPGCRGLLKMMPRPSRALKAIGLDIVSETLTGYYMVYFLKYSIIQDGKMRLAVLMSRKQYASPPILYATVSSLSLNTKIAGIASIVAIVHAMIFRLSVISYDFLI